MRSSFSVSMQGRSVCAVKRSAGHHEKIKMRLDKKQNDVRQIVLFFLYKGAKQLLQNRNYVTNTLQVQKCILFCLMLRYVQVDTEIFYG